MASSVAYRQSVNDNDHVSIKSDDVSRMQSGGFVKENGEHYSKPKSCLPKPSNTSVAGAVSTDAQSTNQNSSADDECVSQHAVPNDEHVSLNTAHGVNDEEGVTHTTASNENGSVNVAQNGNHQEMVHHSPAPPG